MANTLLEAEAIRDAAVKLSRKSRGDLKKRLAKSGLGITPLAYNALALLLENEPDLAGNCFRDGN